MGNLADTDQRISRLTPLAEALARIDAGASLVVPRSINLRVPSKMDSEVALGWVLATDVVAPDVRPAFETSLIDGFAVDAVATLDASPYAPVALATSQRVAVGDRLPPGTDAVASVDAAQISGTTVEILMPVASGAGVLPTNADMAAGTVLRRAGERLRASDLAVLAAVGINRVSVRLPQIRVVASRTGDAILDAAVAMIARWINAAGGVASFMVSDLEGALKSGNVDAIIVIGGTGTGSDDTSVRTLAQLGRVEVHGIGLTPGETAAFGVVDSRAVLLIPGRIDAALAVFATLGAHLLARLTGSSFTERTEAVTLSRKITSTIGLAEFIPLRRDGDGAMPLAVGYLPMQVLARADGWLLVPPDSEGYPAGSSVQMRAWP